MSIAELSWRWAICEAHKARPGRVSATPSGGASAAKEPQLAALAKYIPTETITMFVATVSGAEAIAKLQSGVRVNPWLIYWSFAALTPIVVLLLALAAYREAIKAGGAPAGGGFPIPGFQMAAAFVAYLVWALAVPGLLSNPAWQIAGSIGAVFVSTMLSIVERAIR